MAIPQDPNQRWSLDFVSDALVDGRRFRILCVIDDFSRECLATVVDNSIAGEHVARELDVIAERRGYPLMVVSDNGALRYARLRAPSTNGRATFPMCYGSELTSNAVLTWADKTKVEWRYIAPGRPM